MRVADAVRIGALIRCPACTNILGEEVAGVAVVRYKRRRVIALAVSCDKRGCTGTWIAPGHVDLVRAVVRAVPVVVVP